MTSHNIRCSLSERMDIEERLRAASPTERDKAIRDAQQAGWSIRHIAVVVGMSVGGVHKIIKREQEP